MTKEEFEELKRELKESGKSIKTFLADKGICFTSYYYWKKKYGHPKPEAGLIPIEIHTASDSRRVNLGTHPGDFGGVSVAFPNGLRAHFGRGSENVLMEVLRKSLGEPCSL
ncbi:MAG: hypothetical protein J1F67_06975 [Muribaculaceae bacterium]|nr:hypothetical protein [Muribaculaceae bacterium]